MEITSGLPQVTLPEPFNVSPKVEKRLQKFVKLTEKHGIMHWIGTVHVHNLFYLYLMNKYKSRCLLLPSTTHHISHYYSGLTVYLQTNPNYDIIKSEFHYLNISTQLIHCLKQHAAADTDMTTPIIIPVMIYCDAQSGHANVLIYRPLLNVIEHFEPHGSRYVHPTNSKNQVNIELACFTRTLNTQLVKEGLTTVRFIPAHVVCPSHLYGFQLESFVKNILVLHGVEDDHGELESSGYCLAWCMFFTELVLKNPTISSQQLTKTALHINNRSRPDMALYLKKVIRGYVNFISNKIEKYFTVLFGQKITVSLLREIKQTPSHMLHDKIYEFMDVLLTLEQSALNDPHYDINDHLLSLETILANPAISAADRQHTLGLQQIILNMTILKKIPTASSTSSYKSSYTVGKPTALDANFFDSSLKKKRKHSSPSSRKLSPIRRSSRIQSMNSSTRSKRARK